MSIEDLDTYTILELEHKEELKTKYKCPSCEKQNLTHTKIANIELEYCQNCNGIFFDKGELEAAYPNYKDLDSSDLAGDTAEALGVIYMVTRAVASIFRVLS